MTDPLSPQDRRGKQENWEKTVNRKQERKLRAKRGPDQSWIFGFGTFGLVGWSVAVPTLLCIALGVWIDANWPSRISWTLNLLFIGVIIGCVNAWFWVSREGRSRQTTHRHEEEE